MWGKNDSVKFLLDEYDRINEYWNKAVEFFRGLFNFIFKTNPHLYRGPITRTIRISKESIFPIGEKDNAYIIKSKVYKPLKEKDLEETVAHVLHQIEEKRYEASLVADGFVA